MPDQEQPVLPSPFGRIALSLSGATSYSLGAMSYLHHISLLDRVSFISSTSGGSFASGVYAMNARKGKSFPETYRDLMAAMDGQHLMEKALGILNDDSQWQPNGKQRNIINSFAKAYDEIIFSGEVFRLLDGPPPPGACAVCFNSTEFYKGMSFRFQSDTIASSLQYLGNEYVYFDKTQNPAYKKLKLADIVAASSCFPAGFEPIDFPVDFTYPDKGKGSLTMKELEDSVYIAEYSGAKQHLQKGDQIGFMDGGITDNQGVNSSMIADKRGHPYSFDLIMVCDVASYFMDPYIPVPIRQEPAWRKKNIAYYLDKISGAAKSVTWLWIISLVLLLGSITMAAFSGVSGVLNIAWLLTGLFLVSSILLTIFWAFIKGNSLARLLLGGLPQQEISDILNRLHVGQNFSPEIINKLSAYLADTKLGSIEQMLKARAASVLTLSMDVNLKETRRLIYNMFFGDPFWANRRVYNVIYELSSFNIANRTVRINGRLKWNATPEEKSILLDGLGLMNKIAEEARNMGTTLWFDAQAQQNQMLKKIVACGQFTTCANLLEYIFSLLSNHKHGLLIIPDDELQKIQKLQEQVSADWERFKRDPYFLFEGFNWASPLS